MKRSFLVFLLIAALLLASPALAAKARGIQTDADSAAHAAHLARHLHMQAGRCTGNNIRVRSTPGGATVAGHLEQADIFDLLAVEGNWAQIQVCYAAESSPDSYVGLTGWVSTDYIDCTCSDRAYSAHASDYPGEPAALPEGLPREWLFSSGAGAWGCSLTLGEDGAFSGAYDDSDMGMNGEGYPHGTVYRSRFTGRFTDVRRVGDALYAMTVDGLRVHGEIGSAEIRNQIRYVTTAPAGLAQGDVCLLYLPCAPTDLLSEDDRFWLHGKPGETIGAYFLVSVSSDSGFVGGE